jgi:pimeloyl-ACP methyl ester carboxylesterase
MTFSPQPGELVFYVKLYVRPERVKEWKQAVFENSDSWEYVMNELPRRGLRSVAYDQRGRQYLEDSLAAMERDRARYVYELAPSFFGVEENGEGVSQALIDWAFALTMQSSPRAAAEMLRTNFLTDQRGKLKEIRIPTLIVHGDADQTSPLEITGKRTSELIPKSRLTIYKGAAHGLYITRARRLTADLLEFVNNR